MFNVNQFLAQTKLSGFSKPSYFEIYLTAPSLVDSIENKLLSRLYCKAGSIPGISMNYTEIPHKGMYVTVPTTRSYSEWTCTIVNDTNYLLRTNLVKWCDEISGNKGLPLKSGISIGSLLTLGGGTSEKVDLSRILKDIWIVHYSNYKIPRPTAIYKLIDAFPSELGNIELDWGTNDSTEDYNVTFRFQYIERVDLTISNPFGNSSAASAITETPNPSKIPGPASLLERL